MNSFDTALAAVARRRLIIVSGKGGVGRTTLAALLARGLASGSRRVLVGTTGQDDRLARMMGLTELSSRPVEVSRGLFVQRFEPSVCLREYGALVSGSERLSRMVFDNGLVRRLMRAIPGLDDFSVLGKVWHEAVRARSYDHIVFDGPASGHLMLSLSVPGAILRAVPAGPLRQEAALVDAALRDSNQCCAVLVTLPEAWPLQEAEDLRARLGAEIGLHVGAIVINRSRMPAPPGAKTLLNGAHPDPAVDRRLRAVRQVVDEAQSQQERLRPWRQRWAQMPDAGVVTSVPSHWSAIQGAADLDALMTAVQQFEEPAVQSVGEASS